MASSSCTVVKKQENKVNQEINALFELDVKQAFHAYFPEPDVRTNPEMHKFWRKTKDLLVDYAYNYGLANYNGRIQNIGHFFRKHRENIGEDIYGNKYNNVAMYQDTLGWGIISSFYYNYVLSFSKADPFVLQISKNGYRGVYRAMSEMIEKKKNEFKYGFIKNGLKPKAETFFYYHGSELLNKLVFKGENIDEAVIKKYQPVIKTINNLYEKLHSDISSINLKPDINEYVFGYVDDFYHGNYSEENEIQILKINYKENSKIIDSVDAKYINAEKYNKTKNVVRIPFKEIAKSDFEDQDIRFQDKLREKSVNNFIDDVMSGQIQNWIPNNPTKNQELLNEIGNKITSDIQVRENRKAKIKELSKIDKELTRDIKEISPYVKMKQGYVNNRPVKVFYTVIKRSEDQVGEKYDIFIVKHKFEDEKDYVYYYRKGKNGESNYVWNDYSSNKQLDINSIVGEFKGRRGKTNPIFSNGYYRAKSQKTYGEKINKNGSPIKDSYLKGWDDFEKLDKNNIPNKEIEEKINKTISELRSVNRQLFYKFKQRIEDISTRYKLSYARLSKMIGGNLLEAIEKGQKEYKEIQKNPHRYSISDKTRNAIKAQLDVVNEFLNQLGIENNNNVNNIGKIIFPFETLNEMQENYNQTTYSKEKRNRFMLETINNLEKKQDLLNEILDKEEAKENADEAKISKIKKMLVDVAEKIKEYDAYFDEEVNRESVDNSYTIRGSVNVKSSKHRLPTNEALRERSLDKKILKIENSYKELERLDFTSTLLETIYNLTQNSVINDGKILSKKQDGKIEFDINSEIIDNIVNYSKIVLKAIDAKSKFLWMKSDYISVAKRINSMKLFKPWRWGKEPVTPELVRFWTNQQRAFFTQNFIGTSVAVANSTQSFLPVSTFGRALHQTATVALEKGIYGMSPERINEICETGGAGNILKVFLDMLTSTAMEVEYNDGLSINFMNMLKVFNPGNAVDYLKLRNATREEWYKALKKDYFKPFSFFYKRFSKKAENRISRLESKINYTRSENEREGYRQVINFLYDIVNLKPNEKTRSRIQKILIKANFDVTDATMKKFVEKTMNYRFDRILPSLKKLTAFQQTEMYNHKITYLMAILAADKLGILGYTNEDRQKKYFNIRDVDKNGSRFESDIAIEFGRNAIKIFQFMHSMAGTGEWSWNRGSTKMQFKQFALNRELVHRHAKKELKYSSKNLFDMYKRVGKQEWIIIKNRVKWLKNWSKFKRDYGSKSKMNSEMLDKYGDEYIDYEAKKYVFFLNSAVASSLLTYFAYNTLFLPMLFRNVRNNMAFKGIRGLESPLKTIKYSIFYNLIFGMIINMFRDNDDEKRKAKADEKFENIIFDTAVDLSRLMLPLGPVYLWGLSKKMLKYAQQIEKWEKEKQEQ